MAYMCMSSLIDGTHDFISSVCMAVTNWLIGTLCFKDIGDVSSLECLVVNLVNCGSVWWTRVALCLDFPYPRLILTPLRLLTVSYKGQVILKLYHKASLGNQMKTIYQWMTARRAVRRNMSDVNGDDGETPHSPMLDASQNSFTLMADPFADDRPGSVPSLIEDFSRHGTPSRTSLVKVHLPRSAPSLPLTLSPILDLLCSNWTTMDLCQITR